MPVQAEIRKRLEWHDLVDPKSLGDLNKGQKFIRPDVFPGWRFEIVENYRFGGGSSFKILCRVIEAPIAMEHVMEFQYLWEPGVRVIVVGGGPNDGQGDGRDGDDWPKSSSFSAEEQYNLTT